MINRIDSKYKALLSLAFIICTLTILLPLPSISKNVSALSPYDPGYSHGYDNYEEYAVYDISNAVNPEYDCSEDSEGCHGLIYCDLNDEVACYDRYEHSDDISS